MPLDPAVEETIIAAAKAVCGECRRGDFPFKHESPKRRDLWHENYIRCSADKVYDLLGPEEWAKTFERKC